MKNIWETLLTGMLMFGLVLPLLLGQPAHAASDIMLSYTIDRAQVSDLYYQDLTLKVTVGQIQSAIVTADGNTVPSFYQRDKGTLVFTTCGKNITIRLKGLTTLKNQIGAVSKAALKNNRKWAWSHGYDDNTMFEGEGIDVFTQYGWATSVFMIGSSIHDTRDEGWIIDKIDLITLRNLGWGLGNHTWSHAYAKSLGGMTAIKNDIARCDVKLKEAIAASNTKSYKPIAFAAPMFDADYHSVILDIRDNSSNMSLRFNESGDNYRMQVDAASFNFNAPIGRDWRIESAGSGGQYDNLPTVRWIHEHADETHHYWYNTLCHGVDGSVASDSGVFSFVPYVYNHYGPGGTNEVWVAPSDQVYSYLLVRDKSVVQRVTGGNVTPSPTASPSPSASVSLDSSVSPTPGSHEESGIGFDSTTPQQPPMQETERSLILKAGESVMRMNGVTKPLDDISGLASRIYLDRLLAPSKSLVEVLGGTDQYNAEQGKLTIHCMESVFEFQVGQKKVRINGSNRKMDVSPLLEKGRVLLPLRYLLDNLPVEVQWKSSITIYLRFSKSLVHLV